MARDDIKKMIDSIEAGDNVGASDSLDQQWLTNKKMVLRLRDWMFNLIG